MSRLDELLQGKEDALANLCREYGVRHLKLFGSATTDEFDSAISDLDFLVDFAEPPQGLNLASQYFGLLEQIQRLFGRHVDLLEERAIENTRLRRNATSGAITLYAA